MTDLQRRALEAWDLAVLRYREEGRSQHMTEYQRRRRHDHTLITTGGWQALASAAYQTRAIFHGPYGVAVGF